LFLAATRFFALAIAFLDSALVFYCPYAKCALR
jgi:hypothetical protein